MNVDNLNKLADYLAALPADYKAFEMDVFFEELKARGLRTQPHKGEDFFDKYAAARDAAQEVEVKYARENGGVGKCGGVACAIGHGPSAGFLAIPNDFTWSGHMNWGAYQNRVFGLRGAEWSWCFGGEWSEFDNTPLGAAKRIRYLIANGVPEDFDGHDIEEEFVAVYQ